MGWSPQEWDQNPYQKELHGSASFYHHVLEYDKTHAQFQVNFPQETSLTSGNTWPWSKPICSMVISWGYGEGESC